MAIVYQEDTAGRVSTSVEFVLGEKPRSLLITVRCFFYLYSLVTEFLLNMLVLLILGLTSS